MSSHTGKLPYVCQEEGCGKEFLRPSALRKHSRVHNLGEKRFVCYCNAPDAAFAKFSQLQKHVKEKHPAPPKECEDCGKRFRTKAALERHYETHKEGVPERKHWCQVAGCKAGYVYRKGLAAHVRAKHTNVRRFSCENCSFQSSYKMALKRHMVKIHNVVCKERENPEQGERRDVLDGNNTKNVSNAQSDVQKESTGPMHNRRRRRKILFPEEDPEEENEDSGDGWSVRDTESDAENESEVEESETGSVADSDAEQHILSPWPMPRDDLLRVKEGTGKDDREDGHVLAMTAVESRGDLPAKRTLSLTEDGDEQPRKRRLTSADGDDVVGDRHTPSMSAMYAADSALGEEPNVSLSDSGYFQSARPTYSGAKESTTLLGSLFGVDETVESCEPSTSVAMGEGSSELTTSGFRAVTGPVSSFITSGA